MDNESCDFEEESMMRAPPSNSAMLLNNYTGSSQVGYLSKEGKDGRVMEEEDTEMTMEDANMSMSNDM